MSLLKRVVVMISPLREPADGHRAQANIQLLRTFCHQLTDYLKKEGGVKMLLEVLRKPKLFTSPLISIAFTTDVA